MGMQNPSVNEPLDKLSEVVGEGKPFIIDGIRTVKAKTADYGEGEMVVVRVRGHARECGVWGSYLLVQAQSVEPSDLGQAYVLTRRHIEGFGRGRPVKVFDPAPAQAVSQTTDVGAISAS